MATTSGEYVIPKSAGGTGGGQPGIIVQVFAQTDVGMTREHNEDAFVVANLTSGQHLDFERLVEQPADPLGMLFMVADGMGGAAAGEIASATAVDVVLRHLREALAGKDRPSPEEFVAQLNEAAEVANWSIFRYASTHPELRGMGTTSTIAALLADTLYLAQVGDSRAYLIRSGVANQLTKDQSLMQKLIEAGELTEEEAAQSERRNIILQALGPEPTVKLDLTHQKIRRGDILILCSDGLSGLVRPEEIARVVQEELDLTSACDRLVSMANDLGGPDNITVVAARFEGGGLEPASAADVVGHRVFPRGETPAEEPMRLVVPSPVAMPPTIESAPAVDPRRRERGELYTRVIAAIGALLLAYMAWRLLT
jgi:protein phosphatase